MELARKSGFVFCKRRIKSYYGAFTYCSEAAGWERRVVSGLQPTGALHVGNYFGAVRRCV
ncbi:jg3993, partial [Pararge aegeria aegeria]